MIDFIRKNKDLKDIFEELEQNYSTSQNKNKTETTIRAKSEELVPEKSKKFYEVLCQDFVNSVIEQDLKYDESLIKINIAFNAGTPIYRICMPLIDVSESQTQTFVKCLKQSIKKHVTFDYSVNLCLKKDEETHNIILVLEQVKSAFRETSRGQEV